MSLIGILEAKLKQNGATNKEGAVLPKTKLQVKDRENSEQKKCENSPEIP
jgi:hypothetical protein